MEKVDKEANMANWLMYWNYFILFVLWYSSWQYQLGGISDFVAEKNGCHHQTPHLQVAQLELEQG